MKIVLSALGSRGDVHPVIAIANELVRRGHQTVICVPKTFSERVATLGLVHELYEVDMVARMREFSGDVTGLGKVFRWISDGLEEQFGVLCDAATGADALVTTTVEFAAPSVAASYEIPHYRVAYAPVIPGSQPPPVVPWQRLPPLANRALWWGINRATHLTFAQVINDGRRRLWMPPITDVAHYLAADSQTMLTIDEVLAPPASDWRYPFHYTGYCFDQDDTPLAPELEAFLAAGPPPVYIGLGSMNVRRAAAFSAICHDAVGRLGCRAVIQAGWSGLATEAPAANGGAIFRLGDCNHRRLFPRVAAVVHHGGSGTTHAALRAGVPQLALPSIVDQHYWGRRIRQCGLGPQSIAMGRVTAARLRRAMAQLISDPKLRLAAQREAQRLDGHNGVSRVAELVESRHAAH